MNSSPLRDLASLGQSVWLDDLHRGLIESGDLARLIEDGLSGLTTNPAILSQAIRGRREYAAAARAARRRGEAAGAIYESLAIADVQAAADLFRSVYEATDGEDGYVNMEVSPRLADDARATVVEAQSLWRRIARPNLMIKVPATAAGLQAIRELLDAGINVNATLLFDARRLDAVLDAFFAALESRLLRGAPLRGVASVASFFVSRIDSAVDARLDGLMTAGPAGTLARSLRGRVAFACAGRAYDAWCAAAVSRRWAVLAGAGARMQRLLWASTSTKDPAYRDVRYVEELVARGTVNTVPPATLAAFRDHGVAGTAFERHRSQSDATLASLAALGVDVDEISLQLERDGLRRFVEPFAALERWLEREAG
jgi:transaldolase